jgi:hypothetical protein
LLDFQNIFNTPLVCIIFFPTFALPFDKRRFLFRERLAELLEFIQNTEIRVETGLKLR